MPPLDCLRELGVQPGDRVGICMEKTVDQVLAILGVLFANAVVVPILPRLKRPNIRHIIDNSGMTAMITDAERLDEVAEFARAHNARHRPRRGRATTGRTFRTCAASCRPRGLFDRIGNDDAAIIYSSGSTGRPKGILISHRNLADGADIVADYLGTREDDRIGCVLSFNFDYGLNQIWQTLRKGATLYLHDLALPNDLFAMLAEGAHHGAAGDAGDHHQDVRPAAEDRDRRPTTSRRLRYICSTGGRLSEDMIDDLRTTPSRRRGSSRCSG